VSDFEDRLRRTVLTIADDAPTGDELLPVIEHRLDTGRRRRRVAKLGGGTLAVAALIIAAVVTVAALQQAPSHRKVEISRPMPSTPAQPAKPTNRIPARGIVVARRDGRIVLVDANWRDVRTVAPATPGTVVTGLAVLPDGDHVVVQRRAGLSDTDKQGCGAVSEVNIGTGRSSPLGDAVSFAVSPDGRRVALVGSNDTAGDCIGGSPDGATPQSSIVVRELTDNSSRTTTLGTGLAGGVAFSPDGHKLVVSLCSPGRCTVVFFDVASNGALSPSLRSAITAQGDDETRTYAPRLAWNAQGLYVAHQPNNQVRVINLTTGQDDSYITKETGGREIVSIADRLYLIDPNGTSLSAINIDAAKITTVSPDVTAIAARVPARL
jgi:hypothetical protein